MSTRKLVPIRMPQDVKEKIKLAAANAKLSFNEYVTRKAAEAAESDLKKAG